MKKDEKAKPIKCQWCPSTGRLYDCDGIWLCCACAAEMYDMTDEELHDIVDEHKHSDEE